MTEYHPHADANEYDDFDCFCVGDAVREHHEYTGQPVGDKPKRLAKNRIEPRLQIIEEELDELRSALARHSNLTSVVWTSKVLVDLVISIVGIAVEMGVPFDSIFEEVHRSNMTIPHDDEYGYEDERGNIKRPQVGVPPDLLTILREAM